MHKAETGEYSDRPSYNYPPVSYAFVNNEYVKKPNNFFITQILQIWHLLTNSLFRIKKDSLPDPSANLKGEHIYTKIEVPT